MRFPDWIYENLSSLAEGDMTGAEGLRPVIDQMVAFADKARREGLLALEDDLEEIELPLLKFGLQLVVDGTDPDIITSAMLNTLPTSKARGTLLRDAVIMAGVLEIQAGTNPRVLKAVTLSFLGAEEALAGYLG